MECSLSLTEIKQLQNYIKSQLATDTANESKGNLETPLASTIPTSEIIEAKEDIHSVCRCVEDKRQYFAKIIVSIYKSDLSLKLIDIESSPRKKLANILHDLDCLISYNITMEDLFSLFDESKQEMNLG